MRALKNRMLAPSEPCEEAANSEGGKRAGHRSGRKTRTRIRAYSHGGYSRFQKDDAGQLYKGARSAGFNDLHGRSQDFHRLAGSRLQAYPSLTALRSDLRKGAKSAVPLADP